MFILKMSELKSLCSDISAESRQLIAFDIIARPYTEPLHLGSVLKDVVSGLVQGIDDLTRSPPKEEGKKR